MNKSRTNRISSRHRLLRLTGALAGLLAMSMLFGGHWMVLQSVAWGRMLVDYSRGGSVAEAVSKTFSGQHPCSMCLKIQEGRQQEQEDQNNRPMLPWEKMPELFVDDTPVLIPVAPLATLAWVVPGLSMKPQFIFALPKPPPRGCSTASIATFAGVPCSRASIFPLSPGSARTKPANPGGQGILITQNEEITKGEKIA